MIAGMAGILIIAGTNRPGSNTRIVAGELEEIYRSLGREALLLDLADLPGEIFHPASYGQKPAGFAPFSQAILDAGGLHIVTPEYNGGVPGVLKYFIDMLKFPESFERKPVCFTGLAAGMWGALRPVEQLQAIFSHRNAHIYPERVFMPGIGGHVSPEGRLTNADWLARLRAQAEGFSCFAEALAAAPSGG